MSVCVWGMWVGGWMGVWVCMGGVSVGVGVSGCRRE